MFAKESMVTICPVSFYNLFKLKGAIGKASPINKAIASLLQHGSTFQQRLYQWSVNSVFNIELTDNIHRAF